MRKYVFWFECGMDVYADSEEDAADVFISKFPPEGKGEHELNGKSIKYVIHDMSTDSGEVEVE